MNDKIRLFVCDISQILGEKFAEYCGLNKKDIPKVFIIQVESEIPMKYMMEGEINEENIMNFINDWTKGNLYPLIRSEDIPDNKEGDLFKIVAKTFKRQVLDNEDDILIYFVSPFCQVCKTFEPKLAELSNKLKKNNKHLLIAKMDATLNDIEDVQIHNFPTIAFYPGNAKDKEPLSFYKRRNTTSLLNFIKKNAYHKIIDEDEDKKTTDL